MFAVTNHSEPRSQSFTHYGAPSSSKFNFTALYNQPINESVEFNYPSSSSIKREKIISKQEMEDMKKEVDLLQNKMKTIINEDSVCNAYSAYSSLENSNVNLFDNFKTSQVLQNLTNTTFVPTESLKSSIFASKIVEKQPFQQRNVYQTHSIQEIPSIKKLISRANLGTSHSINTQRDLKQSIVKQSYQHFDKQIGYEKEIMQLKSKITTIQFENDNLQRTLDRTEKRLATRDQQIIKMKQRIFLLEQAKHQIDEKEKTWKQTIAKLEKELVDAKIFKNDPNFEAIFQSKASETNTIRQQLRRKKQQVEYLQERVNQDQKKFEKMISGFNSERLQLVTKVKQTQRKTSTLLFQKDQQIAILKQQLQNFKYNQSRKSKVDAGLEEREPLKQRTYNY